MNSGKEVFDKRLTEFALCKSIRNDESELPVLSKKIKTEFEKWTKQFAASITSVSTRVLRVPGFANRKLPEEFIVQARQESDAVYTLRDFTIHEDSPETPRHLNDDQERPRTVPSDHKSQSEHDWAYAKRALSRGDDPEVVIQRIADYRADDKHNPQDYAVRTVTKAQAELQLGSTLSQSANRSPSLSGGPSHEP